MKKLICFFSVLFAANAFAGDPGDIYRADKISDSLKKNAYAVRRLDQIEIDIIDADKAYLRTHEIITILNEKAEYELFYSFYTDKFHQLDDVELRLFDAEGRQLEKHSKKDLTSTATGSGLVEDGYVHYIRLTTNRYPVTIEKKYTLRYKGLLQLPGTYFSAPYQSVEKAIVSLKHPKAIKVNYKLYNASMDPVRKETGNDISLVWEMNNLEPGKYEQGSGSWTYHAPGLRFNMNNIEMDGFRGDMSSWNNMGLWYRKLVKNTNKLNLENQAQIRAIVASAKTEEDRVRTLYSYLQNNFRYVSIQLGIGGFKPFNADFVHEKKYGDCKGLSNYLEACLDAVGIKSYSAWIRAGGDQIWIDPEFPNDIFNHQILMVPLKKDTVWLECTSNVHDFNHLGTFTENRYALVMTEEGGKLTKTPTSKASQNKWLGFTQIRVNQDGSGKSESKFVLTGEYKYHMIGLGMESPDHQKTAIINSYGFTHQDQMEFLFGNKKMDNYELNINTASEKVYDFKAGSKIFLKPRLYKIWSFKLDPTVKREHDYLLDQPVEKTDTTVFIIPAGYSVESLPKNKSARFSYGSFESRYWYEESTRSIYASAKLVIDAKVIPASNYEEARKFFDQVLEDENQKLVLKAD